MRRRRPLPLWFWAVVVCGLALALRLLHLSQAAQLPIFGRPSADVLLYVDAARRFADAGAGALPDVFFKPPLYPVFLGTWWRVVGENWFWLRLPLVGLGVGTTFLVWWSGRELFGVRVGLVGALLYALHKTIVFFDGELLEIGLVTCIQFGALALLLRCSKTRSRRTLVACGAVLGLACVARPTFLLFAIAAIAWCGRRRWLPCAAGTLLAIAPVTLHNAVRGHDWVLISANFGVNLYIGNNPQANGRIASTPEFPAQPAAMERIATARAQAEAGHELRPSQVSRYWAARALHYAVQHPLRTLGQVARKVWFAWNGAAISDNEDLGSLGRYLSLYRRLPVGMWLVAPLGLVGLVVLLGRHRGATAGDRRVQLFVAYVGLQILAILPFFVVERFRVPWAPALCVASGWMVVEVLSRRAWRLWIAVTVALILCNLPVFGVREQPLFDLDYRIAYAYQQQGDNEAAIAAYRAAVARNPRAALARNALGYLLAEGGQELDTAVRLIEEAMQIDVSHRANYAESLAFAHLQRKDPEAALAAVEIGLAADPEPATRESLLERRDAALHLLAEQTSDK